MPTTPTISAVSPRRTPRPAVHLVPGPSAVAPVPANWKSEGYLDRVPKDPWGTPYQYLQPGVHSAIDVFSFGADRAAGGEGNDADIGNWQD